MGGSTDVRLALDAFRRIVQSLRLGASDVERRTGLTSAQLFALQQIGDRPSLSINDLAAVTHTHQSSVSVVVQRLVSRRLVAKIAAPEDRRRQRLVLTPAGRRALRRAPAAVQERLIAAVSALSAADRRTLARALGAVARAVATERVKPAPMLFEEHGARPKRRARR